MARDNGYDPKKDELVETFAMVKTEKDKGIAVQAFSYDGGPIRIAVQRFQKNEEGKKFYNAGRLNGNELKDVIKGLKKARAWYKENAESEEGSEEKPSKKKAASKEKHHHGHKKAKKIRVAKTNYEL